MMSENKLRWHIISNKRNCTDCD